VKYKDKEYPYWAHAIGVILALSSVVMIPAYFIYHIAKKLVFQKREKSISKVIVKVT